jgi:hypothetical protein
VDKRRGKKAAVWRRCRPPRLSSLWRHLLLLKAQHVAQHLVSAQDHSQPLACHAAPPHHRCLPPIHLRRLPQAAIYAPSVSLDAHLSLLHRSVHRQVHRGVDAALPCVEVVDEGAVCVESRRCRVPMRREERSQSSALRDPSWHNVRRPQRPRQRRNPLLS